MAILFLPGSCHIPLSEFKPKIVYLTGIPNGDLWLTRPGSSFKENVTSSSDPKVAPVFSPEGDALAWVGGSSPLPGYYVMYRKMSGSTIRPLAQIENLESAPTWSPDGLRIAIERDYDIFYVNVPDGTVHDVYVDSSGEDAFDREPHWSPAGDRIAFLHSTIGGGVWEIAISASGGGGIDIITADAAKVGGAIYSDFCWSPDGKQIAYTADLNANPADPHYQICIVEAVPGGHAVNISNSTTFDVNPVWSPTGKRIMFIRNPGNNICVANTDGSGLKILASSGDHPQWSPDGCRVIFDHDDGGDRDIVIMNADGTGFRRVTTDGNANRTPVWSFR